MPGLLTHQPVHPLGIGDGAYGTLLYICVHMQVCMLQACNISVTMIETI